MGDDRRRGVIRLPNIQLGPALLETRTRVLRGTDSRRSQPFLAIYSVVRKHAANARAIPRPNERDSSQDKRAAPDNSDDYTYPKKHLVAASCATPSRVIQPCT